jgi:hypothetical protein
MSSSLDIFSSLRIAVHRSGDEENGHLSDFIEGQGPLENWISVSHVARQGSSYDALASPVRSARSA